MLACEHDRVKPDGVILGKALGGGLLPVSLFLARAEVMGVFAPDDHGSTFGGNPIAAAVGLEALNVLLEEGLIEQAAELGPYLIERLRALKSPLVREVRGKGLFVGLEIDPEQADALEVAQHLLKKGILTYTARSNVMRLSPPLTITRGHIDWATERIGEVFEEMAGEGAAHHANA